MLEILDTTLREGEQTPYVNFTVDEKVEIAKMLDRVGVDMIEAGDPSVSPNVAEINLVTFFAMDFEYNHFRKSAFR